MSHFAYAGPRTTPRPALPGRTVPCATGWKQDVLIQNPPTLALCGAFEFGSQTMSGRALAALEPNSPRPAGSTFDVVTVNGNPVPNDEIPESCHPFTA